jgi:uncharacterized membrane protein YciS (DUF1049 family)
MKKFLEIIEYVVVVPLAAIISMGFVYLAMVGFETVIPHEEMSLVAVLAIIVVVTILCAAAIIKLFWVIIDAYSDIREIIFNEIEENKLLKGKGKKA